MNILITGGAGYIGSVLVKYLLASQEAKVVVVDNFLYQQTSLNHLCWDNNLEIVKGDARDMRIMEPLLKTCDVFIPLAALVGAPLCDLNPFEAQSTNYLAVVQATQFLSPQQRVLIPNTNSGYGTKTDGECTEETPLNPISLYGITKMRAEEVVLSRRNAVSFRLATVFGMSPRMRMDLLVNDFVWRAMTDSYVVLYEAHAKRNYIHVQDVARVFEHGCGDEEWTIPDGAYNVGLSDANLSKHELCGEIQKVFPEFEFVVSNFKTDPDKRDYIVSNRKIESCGFVPRYRLHDGIVELAKGYKQFRRCAYGNV